MCQGACSLKNHQFHPLHWFYLLFHPVFSAFLSLPCLLAFLCLSFLLRLIPIAVRVRAPIPAVLACLWGTRNLFAIIQKNSSKVSNLLENLGMVKQSCLKHATNEASFLKILVRDPSGHLYKMPFQVSTQMFLKTSGWRSA